MTQNKSKSTAAPRATPRSQLRATMEATTKSFIMTHYGAEFPKTETDGSSSSSDTTTGTVKGGQEVCRAVQTVISSLTVDDGGRRTAARSRHVVRFRDDGEMTLEYSWFLELAADGCLIKRVTRFCDEGARKAFEERVRVLRGLEVPSGVEEELEGPAAVDRM